MRWFLLLALLASAAACTRPPSDELDALKQRAIANLVFVEGGSFVMGDVGREVEYDGRKHHVPWEGRPDTYPVHKVTLDSFLIHKYEAVYGDFDLFARATGRPYLHEKELKSEGLRDADKPVWRVNWHDARAYCQWLGDLTGLPFDLPTEAQWEYAARSRGQNVAYATDNGQIERGRNFRWGANSKSGKRSPWYPEPPGSYPPNPLGLYDMSGNVWEWTLDWYSPTYYERSPELNPKGPETGAEKVLRGSDVLQVGPLFARAPRRPEDGGIGGGIRCVVNQVTAVAGPVN